MKSKNTLLSNWQGLLAGIVSVSLFALAPYVIEVLAPEDGSLRPGSYLHALLLGVAIFFGGIFLAWLVVHFEFRSFDDRLDKGWISDLLNELRNDQKTPTTHKICALLAPFFLSLVWLAFSLYLAASLAR